MIPINRPRCRGITWRGCSIFSRIILNKYAFLSFSRNWVTIVGLVSTLQPVLGLDMDIGILVENLHLVNAGWLVSISRIYLCLCGIIACIACNSTQCCCEGELSCCLCAVLLSELDVDIILCNSCLS